VIPSSWKSARRVYIAPKWLMPGDLVFAGISIFFAERRDTRDRPALVGLMKPKTICLCFLAVHLSPYPTDPLDLESVPLLL
jgi:hypothetical protein